jgi:hypothetical protein
LSFLKAVGVKELILVIPTGVCTVFTDYFATVVVDCFRVVAFFASEEDVELFKGDSVSLGYYQLSIVKLAGSENRGAFLTSIGAL